MNPSVLETPRLVIRPFVSDDLHAIHRILAETFDDASRVDDPAALAERKSWLEWSMLNQQWFPRLHQPPYGERAVVLKATDELIGAVGFVPCLDRFDQIPELRAAGQPPSGFTIAEFGLLWAIDPRHQRCGYATEAARALVAFAFEELRLKRIIATTDHANLASQAVMRKLGMTIARNPQPDPPWLQVVGVLANPQLLSNRI